MAARAHSAWPVLGLGAAALLGCGPVVSSAGSGDGSDATGSTSSGSMSCPADGKFLARPTCVPDPLAEPALPISMSACYTPCDAASGSAPCPDGTGCLAIVSEPDPACTCPAGQCCQECTPAESACVPYPLRDYFQDDLYDKTGCLSTAGSAPQITLVGTDADGNTAVVVSIDDSLLRAAREAGTSMDASYQLQAGGDGPTVSVVLGPSIATHYCNDSPSGQLYFMATATSGTLKAHARPPNPNDDPLGQGELAVDLENLVFGTPSFGIVVAGYGFDYVHF